MLRGATLSERTLPDFMNIILVGYSQERTRRALAFCEMTFRNVAIRHRILVFNNAAESAPETPAGWFMFHGSNDLGEFSGWQEGIDHLRGREHPAGVILVNDTVGAYRHLSVFRRWAFVREVETIAPRAPGGIVGFLDDADGAPDELTICGMPASPWVSSYCFALSREVMQSLGGVLCFRDQVDSCVSGGIDENTFFTHQVSPALQRHLKAWLFGAWHRSEPLTISSHRRLSFKARCICAELLLSAHCRKLGVEFRDPLERHRSARALDALNGRRVKLLADFRRLAS